MPIEAFDVDGNPINGVLAPDEVQALQAKLSKLENKDFNFRKLEQMTEDEKAKLSATELSLKEGQEKLEADTKSFKETFVGDIKKDALDKLVGDDADLRAKVEHHFARFPESKTAQSRSEIEQLVNESLLLSTGGRARNPISSALNVSGESPKRTQTSKLSEDAMDVARKMGLSEEDFK